MPTDLLTITLVMLAAGAVGGLVNCFLSDAPRSTQLAWWKHIVIGITASFMVPLFLTMISADLIDKIRGTAGQPGNPVLLLNLAGFCLVASVSSRAFIGSLTERLMREVRDARAQAETATATAEQARQRAADATEAALTAQSDAETAQALARAQVDEEASTDLPTTTTAAVASQRQRSGPPPGAGLAATAPVLAQEKLVLLALTEGGAALRTVAGLAQDSRLDEATVLTVLGHLQQKAWALPLAGSDGQPRWFATAAGRAQTRVAQPA
ncbi:YEATS-associated helix-containing protein [Sphaerotilus sp.]|uniref:YEATS-associated helix-containing protein n=1 Tax=Sphaerotilus sp. TaxID=2093942 RepID=UPI002ACDCDC1|nr:YEATS-associated helix-containing protein [Sphaerotilus sp.]MDZ7858910.1 YEATS-associated helix-containing protein [Sphaerotilus sp.]